ncbi:MAG TPA: glucosidase [Terriglobales bacterium]|nr:glucosidase [Terriglobales bacterium]
MTAEEIRLQESRERKVHWKRWGPYLAERAWGTVREDYSRDGDAWEYFPHEHARSRVYRWNEDGLAGICDRHQHICLALALWNERDPILKERLFGLSAQQGNHGEDVKECYFYLDNTPTHSFMKMLYKYPQAEFPYARLLEENQRRTRDDPEFELLDSGVFDQDRYFDVFAEYAKASAEEILVRITAVNRGPEAAPLHLLPTLWFRNRWSWGYDATRPVVKRAAAAQGTALELEQQYYGRRWLYCEDAPDLLFTENETNFQRVYGGENPSPFVKDGFHDCVVKGRRECVNPAQTGTKAAAHYSLRLGPGQSATVRLRFSNRDLAAAGEAPFGPGFDQVFAERVREADEFYTTIIPQHLSADARAVMRQSFAGMLWSKQYYHYVIERWLEGDPTYPPPPPERQQGRNHKWIQLYNSDVISMPDKWEYPWYAAWDLAFHCIALAVIDPDFAKEQLVLLLREWYMHPSGQLPAYEWAFDDVNPPVHAWAALRVYKIEQKRRGRADFEFLERVFHKLLLNFTWWVNRKDVEGTNIFEGGFLGLDNIGVFDRSQPLPNGGRLDQSDGTSWMAMYTLNMLGIALELARHDPTYEDVATKFGEHFVYIADAMNNIGRQGIELFDPEDGFYYDVLRFPDGTHFPLKVRSMVGLIPLFAVESFEDELLQRLRGFRTRLQWFMQHRPHLVKGCACMEPGATGRRMMAIVNPERLRQVLKVMLDENEFLSPYGIRSLSRFHREHPYSLRLDGSESAVAYAPAESPTGLFGGNSNWRGPVWFPVNYLIVESLQKFHHVLGPEFKVEFPTGSGKVMDLWEVAAELSRRLTRLFLRDPEGRRPVYGRSAKFQDDPHWRDLILFYEYFHGDDGSGLGASHQTGWTGLVAKLLQQSGQ